MRLAKHVKIISSQLENLEDIKIKIECILEYLKQVLKNGQSWLDEIDEKYDFPKLNFYLANETSNCLKKCLEIGNDNQDLTETNVSTPLIADRSNYQTLDAVVTGSSIRDDKDYLHLISRLSVVEKHISTHIKQDMKLDSKLNDQNNITQLISRQLMDYDKKTDLKCEESFKELHAASDFVSHLHSQMETFERERSGIVEKMDSLHQKCQSYHIKNEELLLKALSNDELIRSELKEINIKIKSLSSSLEILNNNTERTTGRIDQLEKNQSSKNVILDLLETDVKKLLLAVSMFSESDFVKKHPDKKDNMKEPTPLVKQKEVEVIATVPNIEDILTKQVKSYVKGMDINFILIGPERSGKSTTAGSILFEKTSCRRGVYSINKVRISGCRYQDRNIKVIDSPGLNATKDTSDLENLKQILHNCGEGFHVFLFVLSYGYKNSLPTHDMFHIYQSMFGKNFAKDHAILIVTGRDMYSDDDISFLSWCEEEEPDIMYISGQCRNRFIGLNNTGFYGRKGLLDQLLALVETLNSEE